MFHLPFSVQTEEMTDFINFGIEKPSNGAYKTHRIQNMKTHYKHCFTGYWI